MPAEGEKSRLSDYAQRLRKEDLSINRDEGGNLIPVTTETDSGKKVRVLPLTFGDVKEIRSKMGDVDLPARLIHDHYVKPSFDSKESIKNQLTQGAVEDLSSALMRASGLVHDRSVSEEEKESVESSVQDGVEELESQPLFEYRMHKMGYTAVGSPTYYALTLQEIRRILEGWRMTNQDKRGQISAGQTEGGAGGREPTASELESLRQFENELE